MRCFKNPVYLGCSLVLLLAACRQAPPPPAKAAFAMSDKMLQTTQLANAAPQPLKNQLSFYGQIAVDNNKLVEVFPIVGGSVTKVYAELGDYVQKGQLLATIRSTEVASFEKDLEDAKADLSVARNRLKVARDLYEGKLSTEGEVIAAQGDYNKAQSQLGRVQETYHIYNIKPGAIYEVRAPLSGFVIQKAINEGMLLRSDKSDNIFDIAQIDEVWALVNVNESDIGQVQLGQDAEITTISYGDRKFYGKVDKVYNFIDPETKAMKVRVRLPNPGFQLKPDMRVGIKISFTEGREMIAIPSSALVFDRSRNYVMVFQNRNHIETRPVEVYRQVGDTTYVSGGLRAGEKVMTANGLLVYDALND